MAYTKTPDVIAYHGNCQDGFTGAWIAHKRYGDYPEYVPCFHDKEPSLEVFGGKDVVFIDFTYKKDVMKRIAGIAKSVVILDHHKTAQADLDEFPDFTVGDEYTFDHAWEWAHEADAGAIILAGFDMKRSGADLAWDFFFPGVVRPEIVFHVGRRDLWNFTNSDTKPVSMWLFSFDYTFENWDHCEQFLEDDDLYPQAVVAGTAIERKHMKDIRELLETTKIRIELAGHDCLIANLPYTMASDGANILATDPDVRFGATWFVNNDGQVVVSLRSLGFDVSAVALKFAEKYGKGGGHQKAAGFSLPFDDFLKEAGFVYNE